MVWDLGQNIATPWQTRGYSGSRLTKSGNSDIQSGGEKHYARLRHTKSGER